MPSPIRETAMPRAFVHKRRRLPILSTRNNAINVPTSCTMLTGKETSFGSLRPALEKISAALNNTALIPVTCCRHNRPTLIRTGLTTGAVKNS